MGSQLLSQGLDPCHGYRRNHQILISQQVHRTGARSPGPTRDDVTLLTPALKQGLPPSPQAQHGNANAHRLRSSRQVGTAIMRQAHGCGFSSGILWQ